MSSKQSRVVETLNGKVQGTTYEFGGGKIGSTFLGIPYAKPPVGELRFQKPVPADKWESVKQCTKFSTGFPFIPPIPTSTPLNISEDSLYLNVMIPEAKEGQKPLTNLPVFFYIHGGGFLIDSAEFVGGKTISQYLCQTGVIVVTFNYRLGIFGFLTMADDETRGNYGLWDMALALKWTHDNISAFGGDPSHITVGGQSAGSASADLLTLSPHTQNLFKQVITLAGTSQCEWMYMDSDLNRKVMVEYAKHLGAQITGKTTKEINHQVREFFKQCDAKQLALGVNPSREFKFYPDFVIPIGPCIDGDFFPKPLAELRKVAPKKSIINGVTHHEALLFCGSFIGGDKSFLPHLNYEQYVGYKLRNVRPDLSPDVCQKLVAQAIGRHESVEAPEYAVKCVDVISDFMFNAAALEFAESRTKHGDNVYNFMFTYYRKGSLGPLFASILPFESATHCMELPYLFGKSILGEFEVKEEDKQIVDRFTTYISSFIKTGCPNNEKFPEKWEKHGQENQYFVFGQNSGSHKDFVHGACHWTKVFKEYPRKSHV